MTLFITRYVYVPCETESTDFNLQARQKIYDYRHGLSNAAMEAVKTLFRDEHRFGEAIKDRAFELLEKNLFIFGDPEVSIENSPDSFD